jgi:hypothetical protein
VRAGLRAVGLRTGFPARDAQAMKRFGAQANCAMGTLDPPRSDVALPQRGGCPRPDRLRLRADSPDELAATRGGRA